MGLRSGELLSEALTILRQRLLGLISLWLLYIAIIFGLMIVLVAIFVLSGTAGLGMMEKGNFGAMGSMFIDGLFFFYLVIFLVLLGQMGSLIAKGSPLQNPQIGEAFLSGLKSSPVILGSLVLLIIGYSMLAGPFLLLAGVLSMMGTVGIAVALFVAVPLLIYVGMRLSLVLPVAVLEQHRNPITVIVRSWALSKGNVLAIFLSLLAYFVGLGLLAAILLLTALGVLRGVLGTAGVIIAVLYIYLEYFVLSFFYVAAQSVLLATIHARITGRTDVDLQQTFE